MQSESHEGLLEVARIVKPHGVRGEVTVAVVSNVPGRIVEGAQLFLLGGGISEWRTVVSSKGTPDFPIVHFEGVSDRSAAERLRSVKLLAEAIAVEGEIFISDLIGAQVLDGSGRSWGSVIAVEANPASDLIVTDLGKYVPSVFLQDFKDGVATIDPPEGLFEL